MKNKQMMPIFIAVVELLLVVLGVVIGIGINKENQSGKNPTESENVGTENTQTGDSQTEGTELGTEEETEQSTETESTESESTEKENSN